jgi:hypothetical protein
VDVLEMVFKFVSELSIDLLCQDGFHVWNGWTCQNVLLVELENGQSFLAQVVLQVSDADPGDIDEGYLAV